MTDLDPDYTELLTDIREEVSRCLDLIQRGEVSACETQLEQILRSLDTLMEGNNEPRRVSQGRPGN